MRPSSNMRIINSFEMSSAISSSIMDAICNILPPILFALLLLLLIQKLLTKKNPSAKDSTKLLPPGPWKLPILGSMHHLFGHQPHRRLRTLANTHGPILHLKLGEVDLIVITSAELAREVMQTHDINFSSRPQFMASDLIFYHGTNMGFAPYGKYWSQLRKICTMELLGYKRVESLGFIREEEGNVMVEKIRSAAGSELNLTQLFLSLTNRVVSRAAFGKDFASQERRFFEALKGTFRYLSGFEPVDLFPSWSFIGRLTGQRPHIERLHRIMDAILNEILEDHRAKRAPGCVDEDLVDVLLRLQKDGMFDVSLTSDNIKAVILDMFFAGTDTAAATLDWAMTELIRNPTVLQKAQAEVRNAFDGKDASKLHYLHHVIQETLRLHPPGPLLLPRQCRETVELGGFTIPSGSRVLINAWAIMRDPKYWEDPERFRPDRFEGTAMGFKGSNFEYIPFGGGRRLCPAITFAVAGIEYWLARLLFHFDWELPGGKSPRDLDVEEAFGLAVSRKHDLRLIPSLHV